MLLEWPYSLLWGYLMENKIDQQLTQIRGMLLSARNDPQLLGIEATLLLAKEVHDLKSQLQAVTAASDFIPGGAALRVVQADK